MAGALGVRLGDPALSRTLDDMDRPPPDPAKLLEAWMEWEHGDLPPGRVMATLKTGGLRELLESLTAAAAAAAAVAPAGEADELDGAAGEAATESWTPVV